MQELLEEMRVWLFAYVKSFYNEDRKIQQAMLLKEEHTRMVQNICRDLAVHLNLTESDCLLAEMMGLFHDVGRFQQFTIYKTFNDSLSENHALLGLKVLGKLPLLEKLSPADRAAFNFAIANHNAKQIEKTEDRRQLLFARLLRDADKLDIYRVLSPFLQPSDGTGCSADFLQRFVAGDQCDYAQIRTLDDRKLVRLMWLYDINFSWTLQRVVERGYVEAVASCLPDTVTMAQGMDHLERYIKAKLSQPDYPALAF